MSPFICSATTQTFMLAAVKIACLWVVYLHKCMCLQVCVFTNTEVSDRVASIRPTQAQKDHRGMEKIRNKKSQS